MNARPPRINPFAGLTTALGLFTIIPAPFVATIDRSLARRAMAALPWLGLLLGGVAAGVGYGLWWRTGSMVLASVGALVVLQALTGAMHLDGLADTADGLGSRQPPDQVLEVMRRSDIGPMGVSSIVLVLLIDAACLASLPHPLSWVVIAVSPMVGRLTAVWASVGESPARPGGFGALVVGVTTPASAWVNTAATLLVASTLGWWADATWGAVAVAGSCLVSLGVGFGWRRHLVRRLGGLTGDAFGSLIEVSQMTFVLAASLLASH